MPRNSSGIYTLPSGNPVVSGTLIEASWANTTLSDLSSAMTGSLSRGGEGGMTAALRVVDGTLSVPGLAFANETSSGLYRAGAGDFRLSVLGTAVAQFLSTGVSVTGTLGVSGATTLTGALTLNGGIANNPVLTAGTANGVTYLNGSKALTSGTALTFDGTNLVTTGGVSAVNLSYTGTLTGGTGVVNLGSGQVYKDASGNVGIGTSSVGTNTRLEVRSANTVTDSRGIVAVNSTNAAAANLGGSLSFGGETGQVTTPYAFGAVAGRYEGSGYSGYLQFSTTTSGGTVTERMRIDSSGNLGIGTSSPGTKLQISGQPNTPSGLSNRSAYFAVSNSNTNDAGVVLGSITGNFPYIAASKLGDGNATNLGFFTNDTERARIDTSGNLLVGTTSATYANANALGLEVNGFNGGGVLRVQHVNGTSGGASYALFCYNATPIGSISQNGTTAVAYNTSSDYRLKEAIAPMTGALAKVALLKPVTYKWKSDGSDGQGFIAHELAEVEAGCVTGEKDAVDADGKPQYQGIDTSFLVATLAAAIQELKAIVDAQGAEIAALKSI